jgi:hypothetical protein
VVWDTWNEPKERGLERINVHPQVKHLFGLIRRSLKCVDAEEEWGTTLSFFGMGESLRVRKKKREKGPLFLKWLLELSSRWNVSRALFQK